MSLTAKQPEGIPCIPGDTYQGICYSLIDIGTQHNQVFNKDQPQIIISWELPDERLDIEKDGKTINIPRTISKTYTNSLGEKANLYNHLISWRGREFTPQELESFDLKAILGANCLLTITNTLNSKGKTVAKIASISKLMKGMPIKKGELPIVSFDMDTDGIQNFPEGIPDWMKDQIKLSVEYRGITHAQNSDKLKAAQEKYGVNDHIPDPDPDITEQGDDIPF